LKPTLSQSIYEANPDDAKLLKNMIGYRGRQASKPAGAPGKEPAAGLDDIPLDEMLALIKNDKQGT